MIPPPLTSTSNPSPGCGDLLLTQEHRLAWMLLEEHSEGVVAVAGVEKAQILSVMDLVQWFNPTEPSHICETGLIAASP